MRQQFNIFLGSVLFFSLISCSSLYTPTTPNIPLFRSGNQLQAEASAYTNGVNGKMAYTPFNHFALQVNGQFMKEPYVLDSIRKGHNYYEGAAGTFFSLRDGTVLEFYGGYGHGTSVFGDPIFSQDKYLHSAKGSYEKIYGQFNIGNYKWITNGACGLSIRGGSVRYKYEYANFNWLNGQTLDHYCLETYMFVSKKIRKRLVLVGYYGFTLIQGVTTQGYRSTMRTGMTNTGVGFRFVLGKLQD